MLSCKLNFLKLKMSLAYWRYLRTGLLAYNKECPRHIFLFRPMSGDFLILWQKSVKFKFGTKNNIFFEDRKNNPVIWISNFWLENNVITVSECPRKSPDIGRNREKWLCQTITLKFFSSTRKFHTWATCFQFNNKADVTDSCETDRFVLNSWILLNLCVDQTVLCWTYVWNWRILGLKRSGPCAELTGVWNWWVLFFEQTARASYTQI